MKSSLKETPQRTLVVNPSARRCGVDDNTEIVDEAELASLVERAKNAKAAVALADKMLKFAHQVQNEVELLANATREENLTEIERAAQHIANLASEAGAPQLVRSCYQLLMTLRQGDIRTTKSVAELVQEDFAKLKQELHLA